MDINRVIKEYEKFLAEYNQGEMFRIRNTMKQLSHALVAGLHEPQTNNHNQYMNDLNDSYNLHQKTYTKLIDSYFPYTQSVLPQMLPLLHDDQFNQVDLSVYKDAVETYVQLKEGKVSPAQTMNKVNSIVRKSLI